MNSALEIASLGRLVETGLIRLSDRNDLLLRRLETARWIEPTGRKNEWGIRSDAVEHVEARLNNLTSTWRLDFEFLRSIELNPYDPRSVEALPTLRKKRSVTGLINRRNWNAAAGLGPKHLPQIASTATLTRDWAIRCRPNNGLTALFSENDLDLYGMASILTECMLPERLWLQFTGFGGTLPTLIVTCENLGAYIDLPLPASTMAIYAPGADIEAAAEVIKALPSARWAHFGDIDPDGLEIATNLAKETGRQLNFYIPSFAEEYLPGRPTATPWRDIPEQRIFKELKRTQKRMFQETFMLDDRLSGDLKQFSMLTTTLSRQTPVVSGSDY